MLALAGCSGSGGGDDAGTSRSTPSPSATSSADAQRACDAVTTKLLTSVQRYVDRYGATLSRNPGAPGSSSTSGTGDDTELRADLQQAQRERSRKKCDILVFRTDFAAGLEKVTADGPLARAVLLRLTASVTGEPPDPAEDRSRPRRGPGPPGGGAGTGSTVTLRAGRYQFRQPLVLLAGITLKGAGRGRTTISSRAAAPWSWCSTTAAPSCATWPSRTPGAGPRRWSSAARASIVLTDARLSGGFARKGSNDGQSGTGVLMTSRAGETTARGTTLQMTRSQVSDNTAAGVLLTGAHRASVRSSAFRGNGQCGLASPESARAPPAAAPSPTTRSGSRSSTARSRCCARPP